MSSLTSAQRAYARDVATRSLSIPECVLGESTDFLPAMESQIFFVPSMDQVPLLVGGPNQPPIDYIENLVPLRSADEPRTKASSMPQATVVQLKLWVARHWGAGSMDPDSREWLVKKCGISTYALQQWFRAEKKTVALLRAFDPAAAAAVSGSKRARASEESAVVSKRYRANEPLDPFVTGRWRATFDAASLLAPKYMLSGGGLLIEIPPSAHIPAAGIGVDATKATTASVFDASVFTLAPEGKVASVQLST